MSWPATARPKGPSPTWERRRRRRRSARSVGDPETFRPPVDRLQWRPICASRRSTFPRWPPEWFRVGLLRCPLQVGGNRPRVITGSAAEDPRIGDLVGARLPGIISGSVAPCLPGSGGPLRPALGVRGPPAHTTPLRLPLPLPGPSPWRRSRSVIRGSVPRAGISVDHIRWLVEVGDGGRCPSRSRWGLGGGAGLVPTGIPTWGVRSLDMVAVPLRALGGGPTPSLWLLSAPPLHLSTVRPWGHPSGTSSSRRGRGSLRRQVLGVPSVMAIGGQITVSLHGGARHRDPSAGPSPPPRQEWGFGEGRPSPSWLRISSWRGSASLMLLAAVAWWPPSRIPSGGEGSPWPWRFWSSSSSWFLLSTWDARSRRDGEGTPGVAWGGGTPRRAGGLPGPPPQRLPEPVVLPSPGIFAWGLILAVSINGAEPLAILCTAWGGGAEIPPWQVLPVLGAVSLWRGCPGGPGKPGGLRRCRLLGVARDGSGGRDRRCGWPSCSTWSICSRWWGPGWVVLGLRARRLPTPVSRRRDGPAS